PCISAEVCGKSLAAQTAAKKWAMVENLDGIRYTPAQPKQKQFTPALMYCTRIIQIQRT
ncbi:MAG: hypothetical protein GY820_00325, partial [Gammaproteobacteria bacterium]|nr:hypothetical protein [Gammaproteobacteria bacterium]